MPNSEVEQVAYNFRVNTILLKGGTQLQPGRINVFVGANNCGKTRFLKEIFEYTIGNRSNKILIRRLAIPEPKTWADLKDNYDFEIIDTPSGQAIRHISPTLNHPPILEYFGNDIESNINSYFQNKNSWDHLRSRLGRSLITFLDTDGRLNLAKSKQAIINDEGPGNLLEILYHADSDKTNKLNEYCWKIFGKKIFLSPYNVGKVELKIGNDFSDMPADPQDARDRLTKVPGLDEQGDGMRSAIGIIAALCAVKKPIVLLDEPEAFLHPPQALQLGEIIGELIDSSQQLFVATHSTDFLRGLLSKTQDVNIIRIDRSNNDEVSVNALDFEMLKHIITDPLLSSSRVLEGLFYKGAVITEADADATFYQRAFQTIGISDEIHFINAHNKQTLKKVIIPYQKFGIKFALIADADVLREKRDMEEILSITEDSALKERVLKQQEKILNFFTKKSRFDVLLRLRGDIQNFASSKLITETQTPENTDRILFDVKKKLKDLREETDVLHNLKIQGRKSLDEVNGAIFDALWNECASVGFFIVPVGELESWLVDYGVERKSNKAKWIAEALQKLYNIKYEEDKELWKFMLKLKQYMAGL